jgi:hypothetical protein
LLDPVALEVEGADGRTSMLVMIMSLSVGLGLGLCFTSFALEEVGEGVVMTDTVVLPLLCVIVDTLDTTVDTVELVFPGVL